MSAHTSLHGDGWQGCLHEGVGERCRFATEKRWGHAPFLACVTIFSAMRPTSLALGTVVLMRSCSMSCVTIVLRHHTAQPRHTVQHLASATVDHEATQQAPAQAPPMRTHLSSARRCADVRDNLRNAGMVAMH